MTFTDIFPKESSQPATRQKRKRPEWIRAKAPFGDEAEKVAGILKDLDLVTVCVEADCPNKGECWKDKHATFMILGNVCTRGCNFCDVSSGTPRDPDGTEPERVARAVSELGIRYAVITSVTRDDLDDRGSGQFERTVKAIKKISPGTLVEILIPDFSGISELIKRAAFSGACVIGHNIEVPASIYPAVRPGADYARSLGVLRALSDLREKGAGIFVKSSLITGLGEKYGDIISTLREIRSAGTDIVYIGQYLSPSREHLPVEKFYEPGEFSALAEEARSMGFGSVLSGPMVRSSYKACLAYRELSGARNVN
jgi:lipoyl synthase